ncbi:MAG TPA: HAMP domain-containing sensor histidine kinase [Actinomycetota bacterium]|nr:HAMP domain-containing sensor histidine kinase [Actinomycetota bacterium]
MVAQRSPWLGIAILGAAVAASVALGDDGWSSAARGVGLGLVIAAAAVGTAAYRSVRDPASLYATIGTGIVAAQGAVSLLAAAVGASSSIASLPALLASHAALAACLALAVPRGERRGRPAPDARRVALLVTAGSVAAAIAFDLMGAGERSASAGTVLPVIAVAGALVAAATALALRTRFGWWSAGAYSGAVLVVAVATTVGGDGAPSSLAIPALRAGAVCEGAFLLAGMLAMARVEASRMRRASDRAEAVLGGRAEIASMLAHEVKGPVSTIKGLAATTAGSYDKLSDAERREFVGLIQDEATRLLEVVDQTSLALKLDARALSFDRRPTDLADVVRDAIGATDLTGRPVDASLRDGIVVAADRRWLAQAIRQGLDNAVRFSPAGSPIVVTSAIDDRHAVVGIADRGPGVPAERRDEVFTRFARWRPPGYEDRQGSGLGLYICRTILAEHAGDASLEGRAGGGTMLRLTIPLDEPPPMEG